MVDNSGASQFQNQVRTEIVQLAEKILAQDIELVSGCRKLLDLYYVFQPANRNCIAPIAAFVSETDAHPLGSVRAVFEKSYLDRLDKETAEYSERARSAVFAACKEIIRETQRPAP
jgi:hypothetical protein